MPAVSTGGVEPDDERRGDGPPVVFDHGAPSDRTAADRRVAAYWGPAGEG